MWSCVALLTPMNEDGSIDYDEIEQILNTTDAIIVYRTISEDFTKIYDDHIETMVNCVDMIKRVSAIVHVDSIYMDTASYLFIYYTCNF